MSLISGACVSCSIVGCERCDYENVCGQVALASVGNSTPSGSNSGSNLTTSTSGDTSNEQIRTIDIVLLIFVIVILIVVAAGFVYLLSKMR